MSKLFTIGRKTAGIGNRVTESGLSLKKLLLPNVDSFSVRVLSNDRIMGKLGFRVRFRRLVTLMEAENKSSNRYLRKQWNRLFRMAKAGNEQAFDLLSTRIYKRSNSLIALGLWRVVPLWYRIIPLKKLIGAIRRLNRIRFADHARFEYKRVMIPKPDGTERPLSVPSLEWRIIANLKNIFLRIWLEGNELTMNPVQHGLLNGKGPKEAWERILSNLEKKNIYEFDLRKFFDTVKWSRLATVLTECKTPEKLKGFLLSTVIYGSAVLGWDRLKELEEHYNSLRGNPLSWKNLKERGWKWSDVTDWITTRSVSSDIRWITSSLKLASENKDSNSGDLLAERIKTYSNKSIKYAIMSMHEIIKGLDFLEAKGLSSETEVLTYNHEEETPLSRGVPQGFGPSPLLASLTLYPLYQKWEKELTMYLDDGILISDRNLNLDEFEDDLRKLGVRLS